MAYDLDDFDDFNDNSNYYEPDEYDVQELIPSDWATDHLED